MSKSKQEELVRRFFGENIPIVDAKIPFRVTTCKADWEGAVFTDPINCVLARKMERITGIKGAMIFRSVSYIPFDVNGDGKIDKIERFSNDPTTTKQMIIHYDETHEWIDGEYIFNPPSKSVQLDSQRMRNKKYRANRKARLRGNLVDSRPAKANNEEKVKWLNVRNGSGQVQMTLQRLQLA